MIDVTKLTSEMQSIGSKVFTPELVNNLEKSKTEFEALNVELVGRLKPTLNEATKAFQAELPRLENLASDLKSQLPRAGQEINNGIKGLSSVLSDFPKDVEPTVNRFLKSATTATFNLQAAIPGLQKPLGELADSLPVAAEKLKPALESAAGGIANAIAGSNVQAKMNSIALTLPTPQAMAETLDAVSKATKDVIPQAELVISTEIEANLKGAMEGIKGDLGGVTKQLAGALSEMKIPDFTVPNLGNIVNENLANISGALNKNFADVVTAITNQPIADILHQANGTLGVIKSTLGVSINIPDIDNVAKNVLRELTVGTNVLGAIDVLKNAPNLNIDVTANIDLLTGQLQGLQKDFGSVSSMLNKAAALNGTLLKSTALVPIAGKLSETFPIMNSLEESFAELVSALKQPEEVEVGWTKTYKDDIVTRDTIRPKNYYHYIVLPNGTIQRDKPVGNDTKLRVAIVGGYNTNRGEGGELTAASITPLAAQAFKKLTGQMVQALPGLNIYGISEIAEAAEKAAGELINPGINVSKIVRQVGGRSNSAVAKLDPPANKGDAEAGQPIGPHVVYVSWFSGQTRNRPIQPGLMRILNSAAEQTGLYVTIFSGGQMARSEIKARGGKLVRGTKYGDIWRLPNGRDQGVATGSIRHDNGYAADVWLYTDAERQNQLKGGVASNPPTQVVEFIKACRALGARSVGVGPNYMGGTGIHVDLNSGGYWGAKGLSANAPQWLVNIMA